MRKRSVRSGLLVVMVAACGVMIAARQSGGLAPDVAAKLDAVVEGERVRQKIPSRVHALRPRPRRDQRARPVTFPFYRNASKATITDASVPVVSLSD